MFTTKRKYRYAATSLFTKVYVSIQMKLKTRNDFQKIRYNIRAYAITNSQIERWIGRWAKISASTISVTVSRFGATTSTTKATPWSS